MGWEPSLTRDAHKFLLNHEDRVTVSYVQRENGTYSGELCATVDRSSLWTCEHDHTKPEHNASYRGQRGLIWEASALKCSMVAYDEFYNRHEVEGYAGMIGNMTLASSRADCSSAFLDPDRLHAVHARLKLLNGVRFLFAWKGTTALDDLEPTVGMTPLGGGSWFGGLRLDHFSDRTYLPDFTYPNDEQDFVRAMAHFAADAHGMMFKNDPIVAIAYGTGDKQEKLVARISTALNKPTSQAKPNIKIKEYTLDSRLEDGVKKFVLLAPDGEEIEEHYRRGTAVRSMVKHNKGL